MQLNTSYCWFKDAVSKEFCEKVIALGTERIEKDKTLGINTEGYTFGNSEKGANPLATPQGDQTKEQLLQSGIEKSYVRDSEVTWLDEQWIYDTLTPFVHDANKNSGWQFQWDWCETLQFTVYHPGGFYSWHQDGGGGYDSRYKRYIYGVTDIPEKDGKLPDFYTVNDNLVGKTRKLSLTLNLTPEENYDGGELKFDLGPHANERFYTCDQAKSQGSIIVFPSFIHHCVAPITRGTRYSLVIWCLGYPFK
jgi:2OG-Fe(II) oxygenase superfamily